MFRTITILMMFQRHVLAKDLNGLTGPTMGFFFIGVIYPTEILFPQPRKLQRWGWLNEHRAHRICTPLSRRRKRMTQETQRGPNQHREGPGRAGDRGSSVQNLYARASQRPRRQKIPTQATKRGPNQRYEGPGRARDRGSSVQNLYARASQVENGRE